MASIQEQLHVEKMKPGHYKASVYDKFCYMNIGHGGTLLSLLQIALEQAFRDDFAKVNQPHPFELHASFLRPVFAGTIDIEIIEARLGPIMSVVNFTISQRSRTSITGFATLSQNLFTVPYKNDFPLIPAPPTIPDFSLLESNREPNWTRVCYKNDWQHVFPAWTETEWYWPTPSFGPDVSTPTSNLGPTSCEFWICHTDLRLNFHNHHLAYLIDLSPRGFAAIRPGSESDPLTFSAMVDRGIKQRQGRHAEILPVATTPKDVVVPTVSMTIEVKKPLPEEGTRWLYYRQTMPWYQGGKFDIEVTVCDTDMNVVAVARLLSLAVNLANATNMAERMNEQATSRNKSTPAEKL